mmetsp:Transcript_125233/g.359667  ORF Transcript_125233/g.359667 Transcript_125233/m.359667 type:complete len:661 (-) Transcript_125233:47-2029(-)
MVRSLKRRREADENCLESPSDQEELSLGDLVLSRKWESVLQRVQAHPEEVACSDDPSALALACRFGAPLDCVKAILQICPEKLRRLLGSRGTPLHEAVVCDDVGPEIIELLLEADVQLGSSTRRATLLQDVDGYTPLHLLIRRRFQSHVLDSSGERSYLMEILQMLVKSSPEAIIVPDRGEYEEPPIVMALKANVYAPLLRPENATTAQIERHIHEIVNCMLQHYPNAASCVFNGYRGKYTALHSAVFHGRCAETIELLIEAEKRCPSKGRAGLLANTQGELPLHFCAMRGEPPRSIALVAGAAPEAVSMRDASGLTPLHWLWIRFVSTLLALEDGGRGNITNIALRRREQTAGLSNYTAFATLVQGDFEQDLALVRRLDPSVDFLRMRHIPNEVLEDEEALYWAEKTTEILKLVRERYNSGVVDSEGMVMFSRIEAVASLFWTKLVSMLEAIWAAGSGRNGEPFSVVRTAFKSISCPPPVAMIVASMYPGELDLPDSEGRLPLHHAARRPWHAWDWPRQDGTCDSANAHVLERESAFLLRTAMSLSPLGAARRKDNYGCLPLHYAIRTFIRACCTCGRSYSPLPLADVEELTKLFIFLYPDSLHDPDPTTGLLPFLQASAVATQTKFDCTPASFPDELAISLVYQLLHENPSLVFPRST